MISASPAAQQKLFGLFEIDVTGTVLYSRIGPERNSSGTLQSATGRNFFDELARFTNVEEFRRRIDGFAQTHHLADSFLFTFEYEEGPQPVRVLLARIKDHSNQDQTKSILLSIRQP